MLVTPDGAERELRPTDGTNTYEGTRDFLRGYSYDTPDTIGAAMRYYSYDGSRLFAVIEPSASSGDTSWTIFMPDGGKVVQYKNGTQRIKDANGNSIKIWTTIDGVTHYQDEQTGRELRVTSVSNDLHQVSYQTVGGGWVNIDIYWGWTQVRGKVYDVEDWWASGGETGQGTPCRRQQALLDTHVRVVREIVFPATEPGVPGRRFSFLYDSDQTEPASTEVRWACGQLPETYNRTASIGTGSLSRMVTPSGAVVDYVYEYPSPLTSPHYYFEPDEIAREQLTEKRVTHDGTTDTWDYQIGTTSSSVSNPDGTSSAEVFYPHDPTLGMYVAQTTEKSGLVYRSRSGSVLVERHWTLMPFAGANTSPMGSSASVSVNFNPVVDAEYTSLLEGGQAVRMSAKTYRYDYNGNLQETKEYDWFDPSLVTRDAVGVLTAVPDHDSVKLLRTTTNSYHNSATTADSPNVYAKRVWGTYAPLILNAVQETAVGPSRKRLSYDGSAYGVAPTAGNVTKVSNLDDQGNANAADDRWVDNSYTYDSFGNKRTATDPNGNVTEFFYEDATHALPTRVVVDPLNGTGQQTTRTAYDFSTGLVTSQTDANNNTSDVDYVNQLTGAVDPFGRPGVTIGPAVAVNGVSQRRKVFTFYEDSARRVRVESDLRAESDRLLKSRVTRDQVGRTVLTEKNEDGSASYTISSRTVYEQMGRITLTSNPSRGDNATTDGWTRVTKDNFGRVTEAATFSGSAMPHPTNVVGGIAGWTGSMLTSYFANETTVTDQDNKSRRNVTDAMGRLARVVEAPDSLNYQTAYTYDAMGNLVAVAQGAQTRGFSYSSLSRLVSAVNPENGTVTYTHDANGNLLTRKDARGVTTSCAYDGLNRVTSRGYTAPAGLPATPAVTFTYDTRPNEKGLLSSVSSSVSEYHYNVYDAAGRVTASSQITDGQTYTMTYGYDMAGNLTRQQYPSGRVVTTDFDAAGRVSNLRGEKPGEAAKLYASQFGYTAHGASARVKLGNSQPGNERWEHTLFNSRLQPVEIGLGTSASDSSLLKLAYVYGTTNNNGNLRSQTITAPGMPAHTQTYTYDAVNRLLTALETEGGSQVWKQSYTYLDHNNQNGQFGNRRVDAANTTLNVMASSNPTISPVNNRFHEGQGYGYDAAGNLTAAPGYAYAYDAESKQISADNGQPYGLSTYSYDADGRRVKKATHSGGTTTVFVYDISGQLVAEYSNAAPQPGSGGTSYLTQDHLGSTRAVTGASGAVRSPHDYLPFGEEINPQTVASGRQTAPGYGAGNLIQKFTSKGRDAETNLDYFGARYYGSGAGRFLTVDPVLYNSIRQTDPQQLNLYAYTRNNPLKYIDPDGEKLTLTGNVEEAKAQLCQMLGDACKDGGANISYDEKEKKLTGDLTGVDLEKNEGAKLLNDVVTSDHQYSYGVGSEYETADDKQQFQTSAMNLPPFPDQPQGTKLSPPTGTDDLVMVNPNAKRSISKTCNCPEKELAPLWGIGFHELAEAYAKVDGSKKTYEAGHGAAKEREERLRQQRPGLSKYLPFTGENQVVEVRK